MDGKPFSITASTEKECLAKFKDIKDRHRLLGETPSAMTLKEACDKYINDRRNILSPSTIHGYEVIVEKRFQTLMQKKVCDLDSNILQSAVNEMAKKYSDKSIKNAAYFISTVCKTICDKSISAALPSQKAPQHTFLEPEQIIPFVEKFKNSRAEAAVLLGLHSLRASEIFALEKEDIDLKKNVIHVHASMVNGSKGDGYIRRDKTKTASSTRDIPILIDRLKELADNIPISISRKQLNDDIAAVCKDMGLPSNVGCHGLRHSFASLAAHLRMPEQECMRLGGWSTPQIMREIYTHVAASDRAAAQKAMKDFYKKKDVSES